MNATKQILAAGCSLVALVACTPAFCAAGKTSKKKVVVAVLPCEAASREVEELSEAIPLLLASSLSKNKDLDLVEREQLRKVLQEQELNLSGLVDPDQAAQLGRLLGAKILVTERAFVTGRHVMVTVKIINVETGRVKATTKSAEILRYCRVREDGVGMERHKEGGRERMTRCRAFAVASLDIFSTSPRGRPLAAAPRAR